MNIVFNHYKECLEMQIKQFESIYGDINNAVVNQYSDSKHTMLVKGKQTEIDLQNLYEETSKICNIFDSADLVDFKKYERNLKYHNGANN